MFPTLKLFGFRSFCQYGLNYNLTGIIIVLYL